MEHIQTEATIVSNFNDENVWDDRRNLYDTYFSSAIDGDKHYIIHLETTKTNFDDAVLDLKNQWKNLNP
jgi:hypothetical protein